MLLASDNSAWDRFLTQCSHEPYWRMDSIQQPLCPLLPLSPRWRWLGATRDQTAPTNNEPEVCRLQDPALAQRALAEKGRTCSLVFLYGTAQCRLSNPMGNL